MADRPDLWCDLATPGDGERSYQLAFRDDEVEIWFISWPQDTRIEMHDHDGSSGALAVLDGSLMETRAVPGGVHRRVLGTGNCASFPPGYIHDVSNQLPVPAVSVHAYSPPIEQVTYYAVEDGIPVPVRTEALREGVPT